MRRRLEVDLLDGRGRRHRERGVRRVEVGQLPLELGPQPGPVLLEERGQAADVGLERGAPVAVLGDRLARELFPSSEAVGEVVRIGGRRFRVIGVLASRGQQLGMDMDEVALVPVTGGDPDGERSLRALAPQD